MRKNYILIFLVHALLLLKVIPSTSQTQSNQESFYKQFDSIIGNENTGLFNGTRYLEKYRTRKGNHKFYITSKYLIGNVNYDSQTYYDIEMKYDIYEEQITVNIPKQNGFSTFQLVNEKINNFFINNTEFINLKSENNKGFYEVVFQDSNLILYKKYKKKRREYFYEKNSFNSFKIENQYLLNFKNNYNLIESKRDLNNLFPEHKQKINSFYKVQKKLLRSNYDLFIKTLINIISDAALNNVTIN